MIAKISGNLGPSSDRSTEFTSVGTTGEEFNGYTLMVEAYAVIWLILLVWFGLLWRRQRELSDRVEGLEQALYRAELELAKATKDPSASVEAGT